MYSFKYALKSVRYSDQPKLPEWTKNFKPRKIEPFHHWGDYESFYSIILPISKGKYYVMKINTDDLSRETMIHDFNTGHKKQVVHVTSQSNPDHTGTITCDDAGVLQFPSSFETPA